MIDMTDQEFIEISSYIKTNYGVNLDKKRPLIEGRLSNHVSSLGFTTYKDYFDNVLSDPNKAELSNMVNRLTTNHTFFMREEDHFAFLEKTILPWIDKTLGERSLRIWSAGCSSGEEPYALSMTIFDYVKKNPGDWETSILASDISSKALLIGQKGEYLSSELNSLQDAWMKEYFTNIGEDLYKVNSKLRNNVVYKKINLLDDFDVNKRFHTIFCRNVMIYFDNKTKTKLIEKFYNSLCDGGYLIIGHSETLSAIENKFNYVSPSIYRKE